MKHGFEKKKLVTLLSACSLSLAMGVMSPITLAADTHAEGAGHSQGGKGHAGKSMMQGSGHGGESLKGLRQGRKDIINLLADDGEDSDRPAWAGQPGNEGKPGGGNAGSDTLKGDDYGDIVVLLRNDDGSVVTDVKSVPVTDEDGNPVLDDDGNPVMEDVTVTYAVAPGVDENGDPILIEIVDGEIPEDADVQAVEFGRLNIARSPEKVLDHSLLEALSKLDGGELGDTVTLDPSGRLVVDGSTIDSPLENLALYEALLTTTAVDGVITLSVTSTSDGQPVTYSFSVPEDVRLELAAAALAAASDKTGELTIDEVIGISTFLGVEDDLKIYLDAGLVDDYSRDVTYADVSVWVLEPQDTDSDGVIDSYVPKEVDILDAVSFNTVDATSIKDNDDGGIDVFTQMADDAVQVLEYVHNSALE